MLFAWLLHQGVGLCSACCACERSSKCKLKPAFQQNPQHFFRKFKGWVILRSIAFRALQCISSKTVRDVLRKVFIHLRIYSRSKCYKKNVPVYFEISSEFVRSDATFPTTNTNLSRQEFWTRGFYWKIYGISYSFPLVIRLS